MFEKFVKNFLQAFGRRVYWQEGIEFYFDGANFTHKLNKAELQELWPGESLDMDLVSVSLEKEFMKAQYMCVSLCVSGYVCMYIIM